MYYKYTVEVWPEGEDAKSDDNTKYVYINREQAALTAIEEIAVFLSGEKYDDHEVNLLGKGIERVVAWASTKSNDFIKVILNDDPNTVEQCIIIRTEYISE